MESEHFKAAELACPCCKVNGVTQELLDALEQFRAAASEMNGRDTPVIVDSAYRCPIENKRVGGVSDSTHLLGQAADIRVAGTDGPDLEIIANGCALIKGIGRSDFQNYVHVDVRAAPARWCYGGPPSYGWIAYYPPKEAVNKNA